MAKNEDLQHMYSEKYGFKVYNNKFRYMEKFVIGSEEIDWKEIKPGDVVVEGYLNLDPKYRTITSVDGKHWEYFEDEHYHSTSPEYCHFILKGQPGAGGKLVKIGYE